MVAATFERVYALDDIRIRSGGDGRTVEAYAAVFMTPTEIRDQQGHYREQIARSAFAKTVQDNGTRFGVFFHHGMTLQGTPSDLGSVPIGRPVEAPRADSRGLLTVTRYNRSALAESVLEAIRSGDITGQSFSGRWVRTDKPLPRGGYRADSNGELPLVTRQEIAMREYGPTPTPAYDVPMVVGVRSAAERAQRIGQLAVVRQHFASRALSPDETNMLTSLLGMLASADAGIDPIVTAICGADMALDAAQMVVSSMLQVPNPDLDEDMEDDDDESTQDGLMAAAASGRRPGTGPTPAATEEPHLHSGRSLSSRVRAGLIARGVQL
jgi:HK97 family phage prohead protease